MAEFSFIYLDLINTKNDASVALGIGDDAAVLSVPNGCQIVQTMDTMVEGIHFDSRFDADALAYKLLQVNLSDIAAMGGLPKWATVSLSTPGFDQNWMKALSQSLQKYCDKVGVNLVGGDTTKGSLSITMNLTGLVKEGSYLTRRNAQIGDDIYVSGNLGDAALALTNSGKGNAHFVKRLLYPTARSELGQAIVEIANSCIDVSDGFIADLGHICHQSQVSALIEVEKMPISKQYCAHFDGKETNWDYALNGGDDYELCFTADRTQQQKLVSVAKELNVDITLVGQVVAYNAAKMIELTLNNVSYQCNRAGWEHQ